MRIALTGGGTAGHVIPNIALLPALRERGFEICYIGSTNGIERELVARGGHPILSNQHGQVQAILRS